MLSFFKEQVTDFLYYQQIKSFCLIFVTVIALFSIPWVITAQSDRLQKSKDLLGDFGKSDS